MTDTALTAGIEKMTAPTKLENTELGIANDHLAELAAQAGFTSSVGTVAFAGSYATGEFAVQYNMSSGGYSSVWPQWAFELAKDALLANKRLWVGANGDPFGFNLVFVLVMP